MDIHICGVLSLLALHTLMYNLYPFVGYNLHQMGHIILKQFDFKLYADDTNMIIPLCSFSSQISLQPMWTGFHCHTQGLSAGFALIAVNMVRPACIDCVCRKVYQSAFFLHPIITFAIIFKMFVMDKHVCKHTVLCSCVSIQVYLSFMYLVILVCSCTKLGVTNCSMRALEV